MKINESPLRTHEMRILLVARVIGWANTLVFIILLITSKNQTVWHSILCTILGLICIVGTLIYYIFWSKIFKHTCKNIGNEYVSPYRLGTIVIIFGMLYVLGVKLTT